MLLVSLSDCSWIAYFFATSVRAQFPDQLRHWSHSCLTAALPCLSAALSHGCPVIFDDTHCCPVSLLPCLTAALFQCCPVTVNQTHGCHVTLLPCLTSAFSLSTSLTADAALCHYCSVSLLPCLIAALSMSITRTLPCLTSLSHDPCFSVGVLRAEGISMFSPTHTGSPNQPSCGDELIC